QPPSPPKRRPGRVLGLGLVLLGLAAAGALYVFYGWSQQQYYVGTDDEYVAIYRGLSPGIAGSLLSTRLERRDLPLTALPPHTRDRVDNTIPAQDLEDARQIVGRLEAQAQACAVPAVPTPAPSPASPVQPVPPLEARGGPTPLPLADLPCKDAL
ncbi:MAG: serine/threonine-protein phosphatase, partial [Actinomycetota bacterium]|nr:serine/threonine-protein phosphatase [Actinomycetota bacterium]